MRKNGLFILAIFLLMGCSSEKKEENNRTKTTQMKTEAISRMHSDHFISLEPPKHKSRQAYAWENYREGELPKITKEYFRCKGHILNNAQIVTKGSETVRYYDCGGPQRHSLPVKEGKEFVYPILLDLLNYLQEKTKKKVVITCGHRCPEHNTYVDPSVSNQASKHMIGAEVDFYVQGMEGYPYKVVDLILNYFKETSKYKGLKDFQEFKRYEKADSGVSIAPWYNKEIFLKIYKHNEGRDFDNRHPYPYISLQVRYDWDSQEKVQYSWDQAFRGFHRY